LRQLHATFVDRGWILAIAAPFDNQDWSYRDYSAVTDYQILMAYDKHFAGGEPGAIAPQPWFIETLNRRMGELDPAKTIIAIVNYCYDWGSQIPATDLTFSDAMQTAEKNRANIVLDPETLNPHFDYRDDHRDAHEVWFLNATTAYNEIQVADIFRPKGY